MTVNRLLRDWHFAYAIQESQTERVLLSAAKHPMSKVAMIFSPGCFATLSRTRLLGMVF